VHYGPHTWPEWGNAEVADVLESQRDTYKFIHDQALRYANKGYTPLEAADEFQLPDELGRRWFNRGYHGTLHHDIRAVYTKELGLWDGDTISPHPHPPMESSTRYVHLIGADRILEEGRKAFESADYRWAVQVLHHLVFAQPDNTEARHLQADAYEQRYQAEGPQRRGVFLTAALELRDGIRKAPFSSASPDTINSMPVEILFDFVAVHLNGPQAAETDLSMIVAFTDLDDTWTVRVHRGVLNARNQASPNAALTISGPKLALVAALLQPGAGQKLATAGQLQLDGDQAILDTYGELFDEFAPDFPIVTP